MNNLRSSKDHNELLEWTRKASELLNPHRWMECRPERSTNALGTARQQLVDWKQAWNEFETKVGKMNGMCQKLTWCQACELERLTKWGESVNAEIQNNCEQIIFEHENETNSRKNDIKAGDNEDDKTIKASNKWNREAVQGQNNHYCPEYECDPISEEDFNEFCCVDEYQDQGQQEYTGNEQGGYDDECLDQRQLEYAGDQQGYSQEEYYEYETVMPQPTNDMKDCRWQPNWNTTKCTTRGAAWQAIREQPWVQQTRRMDRDNKYTPENMAKTRLPPEFAGILVDNARLTQAIADAGCTSTIVIPGTPIKSVGQQRTQSC